MSEPSETDRAHAAAILDGIDSSKGYVKDNIVPCCSTCNHMKWNLSAKDFIARAKKIAERNK